MSAEAALTPEAARAVAPELFPERKSPTKAQIDAAIEKCLDIQRRAVTFQKRPFAALLLGPDNETVLLSHQSVDQVNHAESSLARLAYCHYTKEYLWTCTLVSTWEPCAMCSATVYWAHIGRVIYAASNEQLATLTGPGNKDNFTMNWHTRDVLLGQQKDVEIIGPVEGMDKVVMEESDVYWKTTRKS
ncbi:Cytidine deaminase-like protein [Glarea lozoyensis ATCC 20868]|uniref:Cytidine deaminase-like protein n=1 Tax=Glarea lozoyensis (strain ATCC 20868 / MF5171) TaxID=1116229 RepID=S3CM44_GLAL2|nr:Cytidine deaminase-like protein [Glarea lozoyensis ATCC 20868]EPE27587.1 Cytidine deaminase-like protein [Glarea lozoyensis ATCC 20868]